MHEKLPNIQRYPGNLGVGEHGKVKIKQESCFHLSIKRRNKSEILMADGWGSICSYVGTQH